jgi:hypothetical protein
MKKSPEEAQTDLASAVLNPNNPVLNLGLSADDGNESGGGSLGRAVSTAREAMGTCAGCIRAHLQNVFNCFGGRQNS